MVTKLLYFELQEVMCDNARSRQTMTYSQSVFFAVGNEVVIKLCRTFVYRWLQPPKKQAKQRTLSAHFQSVVIIWLIPAFLITFLFKKFMIQANIPVNKVVFLALKPKLHSF